MMDIDGLYVSIKSYQIQRVCWLFEVSPAQIASQKGVEPDDMEDFKKVDLETDLAD